MKEEEFLISTKCELLHKVIGETRLGNIQWKYAFAEMMADYYAEWRGKIFTIRWLRDEGPRLRVFAKAKEALITYDSARNVVTLPRETKALVTCWEWELSKLNRYLCECIAGYLKPEERREKRQEEEDTTKEHVTDEIKEIKGILNK